MQQQGIKTHNALTIDLGGSRLIHGDLSSYLEAREGISFFIIYSW